MATWRSPSTTPVHIALLSGHAVVIGPDGRDLLPLFESAALAAGCIREPDKPEPKRRGRPPNPVEAVEAVDEPLPLIPAEDDPPAPHAPTE